MVHRLFRHRLREGKWVIKATGLSNLPGSNECEEYVVDYTTATNHQGFIVGFEGTGVGTGKVKERPYSSHLRHFEECLCRGMGKNEAKKHFLFQLKKIHYHRVPQQQDSVWMERNSKGRTEIFSLEQLGRFQVLSFAPTETLSPSYD
jgi:hypothetical protein